MDLGQVEEVLLCSESGRRVQMCTGPAHTRDPDSFAKAQLDKSGLGMGREHMTEIVCWNIGPSGKSEVLAGALAGKSAVLVSRVRSKSGQALDAAAEAEPVREMSGIRLGTFYVVLSPERVTARSRLA